MTFSETIKNVLSTKNHFIIAKVYLSGYFIYGAKNYSRRAQTIVTIRTPLLRFTGEKQLLIDECGFKMFNVQHVGLVK